MNEQTRQLEAIRNRCKTSEKVIRILQILVIIALIGALIGAIACFAFRDAINQGLAEQIANGSVRAENLTFGSGILNIAINYEDAFASGNYATPAAINCVLAVVILAAVFCILMMFRRIFKNLIEEENPFADSVLSSFKICSIISTIVMVLFVGVGPGVICGLLCWCIYSIFQYGRAIQTEIDETL